MDISGVSSNLNMQTAKNAKASSDASGFESTLTDALKSGDEKQLKKACQDFESIFMSMMFKSMRATVDKSSLVTEDQGTEIFQGMLDDELTKNASEAGGIGLANMLFDQLKKQLPDNK